MKVSVYPRFSEAEVEKFIADSYELNIKAKCLVGDIGQNFQLKGEQGRKYIFKIANPAETFPILEAQNQVLIKLANNDKFESPILLKSKEGLFITPIINEKKESFNTRLMSFIDGIFLAEADNLSPKLLSSIGDILGEIDKQIENIDHPALHRFWYWDLKHVLQIRTLIKHIKSQRDKSLVEYFLLQFENEVVPKFIEMRRGAIHNDANDYNLLVKENGSLGVIDFGDMVNTYIVFELAIALAYLMFNKENPVEDTLEVVAGYHKKFPLQEIEIEVLFYSICARLCLSVTMSAYQRQTQPDNEYISVSEENAWALLWKLLEFNPLKAKSLYSKACGKPIDLSKTESKDSIIEKRKKLIGKSLSISYKEPLKIVRGAMQYLYDGQGDTYLDCVNNVCHVGHCHPHVVQAAQKQVSVLNTNTRYLHDNLIDYADRLTKKFPDPLSVCFFVNSGSEANELALRLAYAHTGQKNMIILDHAYHGNTPSLIDISPYKYNQKGGAGPGAYTVKAELPDVYRGPYKKEDLQAGNKYAEFIEWRIQDLKKEDKSIAGFICESLPGCGGQIVFPQGYLKEVYKKIRAAGGVCIADEVQVGFGRVGSHFWGFELQDVVPDIVTMGKPIGNGHPLAAVVTTREIADSFNNGMEFFNTFGGNPVSCAIGLSVLDVIESEQLQENALKVGSYLISGLENLKSRFELIGDVRGAGLFIGVELVRNRDTLEPATDEAALIIEKMKEKKILISTDGPYNNVLKLKPPIVFSKENADRVIANLEFVLKENFSG
ncbi:MAG: aminotransferase class III-fold pyridoxal phosphate-dependent enzyme [Calditrichaeota bacterium]|nr:MAG: aminotransferase class III-fold pyridoxal phosphate-dependent enzyme [Calditrichota bacterium]MBL1205608.1 aminotransferase class III-fold pyridoxal phosphate-dependent enzyme [Calditrichota bacterium]NOG45436.1 aminotransferase class III-fold pyridoxal phosphate-dependent enzyme [Calditrichota bacterium]